MKTDDIMFLKKHISIFSLLFIVVYQLILFGDNTRIHMFQKTYKYYLNSFGVKQTMTGDAVNGQKMISMEKYMEEYLEKFIAGRSGDDFSMEWMKEQCTNNHANCLFWAVQGECTTNPVYMEEFCPLACQACHKLKQKTQKKSEGCPAEKKFEVDDRI